MKESVLANKAMDFAVNIVELHKELVGKKKEREMAGQIKRSGTAIGALLCEAKFAESSADFVHKMKIALKECHETDYWLNVLHRTNYIDDTQFQELESQNTENKKNVNSKCKYSGEQGWRETLLVLHS